MCISFRTPNYDLRQGSFQEGWYQFLNNLLDLEYSPSFACSDCELRTMCPMCPALSLTELGDMQAKVPFACQVTHLRQAAFDRPMHT